MTFFKKNLLFFIVVALCVAAFLAGAFLAFKGSANVEEAQRSVTAAEAKLTFLLNAAPAPTEANLAAAEANLAELQDALAEIRADLQRGAALDISDDSISVIAGIQEYISRFQKATATNKNEEDEAAPIVTPNDFAFGFKQYLRTATPPPPAKAAVLDKQRQILSYLLSQLILASPHSIKAVEREILEDESQEGFLIDEAISARVPGAIDTMAYSMTFTGYTDSLRDFLNSLSRFELPIVVRSIAVKRPSGSETVIANSGGRVNEESIFELFGGGGAPAEEATEEWPKAVIEENISEFTVILEFIEVVLPDNAQNQEDSDPA